MGLIIARLYEYRDLEARQKGSNIGVKHVTLIEEAHRVLTRASSDMSNLENVSTKAKAVETFCNILSEIRAFGEGVLIAEQIPVKLAQDAIKNTNLKVMHRIVAKDDRDVMGHTMNLNEKQNTYVSIMERGNAAAFSEGFGEPFLIKVPHYQSSVNLVNPKMITVQDRDVSRFMAKRLVAFDHIFGKQSGCKQCQYKCVYRDVTNYVLAKPDAMRFFTRYIYAIVEKPENFTAHYHTLKEYFLRDIQASIKKDEEANDIMFCVLITAGEQFVQSRIRQFNLSDGKGPALLAAYTNLINAYFSIPVKTQLSAEADTHLKEFRRSCEQTFFIKSGPFPGCNEYCKHKCLFRYDVEPMVKDATIDERYKEIIRNADVGRAKAELRKYCIETARSMTISNSAAFVENIALCFFIQKSVQDSVKKVLDNVKKWFLDMTVTS
jgi:hypothetical protein